MRLIDGDALIEKFNEKVDMAECLIDARTAERFATFCALADAVEEMPTADVEKISDGYHTFADLYEQRLILSAALAKNNPHAWKSKRHEDGSIPFGGGWFIMGFDTDEGCYTYHYELKDWDLFQCKELGKGKPWDGHTSKDVRRLLSISATDVAPVRHGRWKCHSDCGVTECSACGWSIEEYVGDYAYCPNCGAKMDEEVSE